MAQTDDVEMRSFSQTDNGSLQALQDQIKFMSLKLQEKSSDLSDKEQLIQKIEIEKRGI